MTDPLENKPEIDYLSKDYASFRQLMLDHLALRVPAWKEPSEADLGNVLVEILAYAGDYLSYYQDAVATEAYPGTARMRSSIKRHVRMLDYILHEGCNARVWVQVQVSEALTLPAATPLLTAVESMLTMVTIPPNSSAYISALQQQARVFETLHPVALFPTHNEIALYAEEGVETSLPAGATSALLCQPPRGQRLHLRSGDVLIFEEVKNVETGSLLGADPAQRYAVRLRSIEHRRAGSQQVVYVTWDEEDALPSPLRIAVRQQGDMIADISVARGNIVLADHGLTIRHEELPPVLSQQRYSPYLQQSNLTYAVPYDHQQALMRPACAATAQDVQQAQPVIALFQQSETAPLHLNAALTPDFQDLQDLTLPDQMRQQLGASGLVLSQNVTVQGVHGVGWELHDTLKRRYWLVAPGSGQLRVAAFNKWTLRRDLLSSNPLACDYVVDTEEDRRSHLRFGSGKQGRQPQPGDKFRVTYRVGGGEVGNVRADTIGHIVSSDVRITQVRNPLTACGGSPPEVLEEARFDAPYAIRTQERCVTEEDYATIAARHPQVAHAVARLRWVGSWHTAYIYVQRTQGRPIDEAFATELARFMDDFRLAAHNIAVRGPYFVALDIALRISLQRHAIRSVVSNALLSAFSSDANGFFFHDNFTFGQAVYQSQVIARAMSIAGIAHVEVERFCRLDAEPDRRVEEKIEIQPLEIARLENDKATPYNGIIQFLLEGGL
jgi:hypothetical protein